MCDFNDDGLQYTRSNIPAAMKWQKLAAEQLLPGQAIWSFRADGKDCPSQYNLLCQDLLLQLR
jgi:hypothetical protein